MKKINKFKTVYPQTYENKVLKPKVLDDDGDLFNGLYYIYKDKYNEKKDGLNAKIKKVLTTKNRHLLMIICASLKKKKKENLMKKIHPKISIKKNHSKSKQKMI